MEHRKLFEGSLKIIILKKCEFKNICSMHYAIYSILYNVYFKKKIIL